MFTHQSPAMPSRYSRPSASTTVESLPETMTSCCCSSCLCGTIGWMTLSRSCRTTAGRSGAVERGLVGSAEALAGELDQVIAHHRGLDQLLDLAAAQSLAGDPPESAPVVGAHSQPPDDASQQGQ